MWKFIAMLPLMWAASTPCHSEIQPKGVANETCAKSNLADEQGVPRDQYHCWAALQANGEIKTLPLTVLKNAKSMLFSRVIYLADPIDADSMGIVVRELDRRPHKGASEQRYYYHALLKVNRPDEAEALIRLGLVREPSAVLRRVPAKNPPLASNAVYWMTHTGKNYIDEREVDLTKGSHVIVYTTPICGFCLRAAKDIRKIPAVHRFFRTQGLWVTIPDSNHGLDFYDEWNPGHPDFPIRVVFDRRNWPEFPKNGSSPTFTFMKDGQVVAVEKGYPEGRMKQIVEHLKDMGVIDAGTAIKAVN